VDSGPQAPAHDRARNLVGFVGPLFGCEMAPIQGGAGQRAGPRVASNTTLTPQEGQEEDLAANERRFAWISVLFSFLALEIVAIGLNRLMSHKVSLRTNGLGLRLRWERSPAKVIWTMLLECHLGVGAGLALEPASSEIV
jgi:hypothetical protein